MLGVISAISPEKATVKVFRQKFKEEKEVKGNETVSITKENPFEIRIRDLGEGNNFNFKLWIEAFDGRENAIENNNNKKENETNKIVVNKSANKLIIKKTS